MEDLSHPPRTEEAVYWYRQAANAGDRNALLHLAELHLAGNGVAQDVEASPASDFAAPWKRTSTRI